MPTEFATVIPVTLLLKDGSSGEKVINAIKPNTVKASAATPKKSLINIGTAFVNPFGKGLVSGPYVKYGFTQILESNLLEDFPKLRVAFLEAGSEWVVSILSGFDRQTRR